MRERLIDVLRAPIFPHKLVDPIEVVADYLLDSDVVPVVRCKECQKGHPELAPNGGVWCAKWNHIFEYDEFCSKAEKKEA